MQEDAELLRRYADCRDQVAFAELVNRHVNQVYASALRRTGRDAHLAADAAQLVFIALARQSRWLVSHPALSAWLHLATRNHAANLVRGESRRKRREQEASLMNDESSLPPFADEAWKDANPSLDEALDQLSERDRAAVLLHFVEKRTYSEIGVKLGLKENAVRMRVDRALERLRAALARKGLVSTASLLTAVLANQSVTAAPVHLAQAIAIVSVTSAPAFLPSFTTLYQLMTTTKTAATVSMSALALFLFTATAYESKSASRAQQNADEAFARAAIAAREAALLSQQADSAQSDLIRLKATADSKSAAQKNTPAKDVRAGFSARRDPTIAGNEFMLRHPEVKTALLRFNQEQVATRYQAFFNAMHLSPAQIQRMKELLSVSSTYSTQMENDTVLTFAMPNEISWATANNEIQTALGEEGYKQYLTYGGQNESREVTTNLSQALIFSQEPLSSEQTNKMVTLLTAAVKTDLNSMTRSLDWSEILTGADTILSPMQLQELKAVQSRMDYNKALFAFQKTATSQQTK